MDGQDKQWYTNNESDNVAVTTDASSSHMGAVSSASNVHLQNDANSNPKSLMLLVWTLKSTAVIIDNLAACLANKLSILFLMLICLAQ